MSRNSAGTYTAPSNSVNPAVEGAVIDETDFNALVDDLEAALTESLSISGKGKVTHHIDFDETTVSSPAANVGRVYVKDVGGVTSLFFKDNAGTDTNLLLSSPGLAFTFSTTTTMADPGSGLLRFNNATISSVTAIAIDDNDANGADISNFILSWDDVSASDRGKLIIQNRTSPGNVAIFTVSGASTDNAGWTQLAVTYVTHAGSFGSNAPLGVTFSPSGATGLDGVSAGFLFQFSTSTTTTSDPGVGYVRLNNATLASVTEIAIDDQSANSGNPDVSAFVLTWDDSTSTSLRGTIIIKKATALQNYAIYSVTGASTDESGWTRLAVTHVGSNGSFSNNDSIGVEFARAGNIGATGSTGSTGAAGANGTDPGIRWLFDGSTTMADPGSGDLRLNNATLASVTAIAVSDNCGETGNPDVSTFVLSWDDSTTTALRGTLIIKKVSAPQNFAIYSITGSSTDNSGWTELAVTHVQSSGSFSAADPLAVQFTRTGSAGSGIGDVVGPASSTNNGFVKFDGTTGKLVKDSAATVAISTEVSGLGTGVATFLATPSSANLAAALTDETGSGANVFATSPTLVTPVLGAATATSINKLAITAPATSATLIIADGKTLTASNSITLAGTDGKTLTASNSLTLAGTDSTTMTFPSTSSTVITTGNTATITKGYTVTPNNIGTVSSGTNTPDPSLGNYQYMTNNGAHTLAVPASDCAIDILVTNGASAGAITISGSYTAPSGGGGDTYATTNANKYLLMIRRINSVSTYAWKALQ